MPNQYTRNLLKQLKSLHFVAAEELLHKALLEQRREGVRYGFSDCGKRVSEMAVRMVEIELDKEDGD